MCDVHALDAFRAFVAKDCWSMRIHLAQLTKLRGASGGVTITTQRPFQIFFPADVLPLTDWLGDPRGIAAMVRLSRHCSFLALSVYLHVAEDLSDGNRAIVAPRGQCAHQFGTPFLWAADWQFGPATLSHACMLHALLVAVAALDGQSAQ
jgi:hypothetical protein